MVSRRHVLRLGAVGGPLLPLVLQAHWDEASPPIRNTPYKVVFDERFASGTAFAALARERGMPVHPIRGDVTPLWYGDLYYEWRRRPAVVSGLTTAESLFCLELLARDAGLAVTRREPWDGGLVSWEIGPRP